MEKMRKYMTGFLAALIAGAALFAAHHMRASAIVSLTQSGSTALWVTRLHS